VRFPLPRRRFLKTTAAAGLGLFFSRAAAATSDRTAAAIPFRATDALPFRATDISRAPFPASPAADLQMLSTALTADWAKKLLALQVLDQDRTDDYGGIICPSRKIVHGRVGDTIYPFLHMAHRTNDSRYVDASVLLYRWMERRVSQPDGSWLNEPAKDSWKGTTVFSAIALCEAIHYHGELMDPTFRRGIRDRLSKAGDFIYNNVTIDYGNINYPLSASYAMALLGTQLDIPRFKERSRMLAHQGLRFVTQKDGFVFGEGTPYYEASKKGCFSVDLGYNVEETLPSLALYGLLTGDEEVLQAVTRSLQTHMEFMLPDGGWDNSWGTRNYKWTWWGSRTSDGCQPAYALLADRDPRFYRAALKNTQLLDRNSHEGLLYGGPHYLSHHIAPSVHHTFCHIKALTTILDHGIVMPQPAPASPAILLPRESAYGSRWFADIQTALIAIGGYRATVTGYDREYKGAHNGHASGGALSLLWHEKAGPLLVASMNAYQMVEAGNMQTDNDPLSMPLTPRIELNLDNTIYMNISDLDAVVTVDTRKDRILVHGRSKLVDKDQHDPPQGAVYCHTTWAFTQTKITLYFHTRPSPYEDKIRIIIPLISASSESIKTTTPKKLRIQKEKAVVTISADKSLQRLPTTGERLFNFVPGLEAIPLVIFAKEAVVRITVKA
jgi:hypothetical protein